MQWNFNFSPITEFKFEFKTVNRVAKTSVAKSVMFYNQISGFNSVIQWESKSWLGGPIKTEYKHWLPMVISLDTITCKSDNQNSILCLSQLCSWTRKMIGPPTLKDVGLEVWSLVIIGYRKCRRETLFQWENSIPTDVVYSYKWCTIA